MYLPAEDEAVLLGAGRYRYLAGATPVNALVASFATVALLTARPLVTSAWACLSGFFVLRFAVSAGGAARRSAAGGGRGALPTGTARQSGACERVAALRRQLPARITSKASAALPIIPAVTSPPAARGGAA